MGTTVFQGLRATDADTGVNGLVEYFVTPGDASVAAEASSSSGRVADGYGVFTIRLPHQGQVVLNRSLDFERTQKYLVTIVAAVSLLLLLFKWLNWKFGESTTSPERQQSQNVNFRVLGEGFNI